MEFNQSNKEARSVIEMKKIGRFDGYRTNAFFGFDMPPDPDRSVHWHVPKVPSK